MRELEPGADVARRVDPPVRRTETIVNDDTVIRDGDARDVEVEPVNVRRASGGNEQPVSCRLTDARRMLVPNDQRPVFLYDFGQLHAEMERHPVAGESPVHDGGSIRIVVRQHARRDVEDRDRRSEAGERLRQLASNRTAADDEEPARQLGQREDGFAREVRQLIEAAYRRRRGPGAGRDNGAIEREPLAVDLNCPIGGETSVTEQHGNTGLLHALNRVVRADFRAPLAHTAHDRFEIGFEVADPNAHAAGAPHLANRTRGAEQRFRRHAAGQQAVSTQKPAFDQRHARAEARGANRADEAGRAAADDDEIVHTARLRVDPAVRTHRRDELPIRFIEWDKQPLGPHAIPRGRHGNHSNHVLT